MRTMMQQAGRARPAKPVRSAVLDARRLARGVRLNAVAAPTDAAPVTEAAPAPNPVGYKNAVVLQGFGWDSSKEYEGKYYEVLLSKVPEMQAAGVTHVWLPPPSRAVAPEGYLPTQWYDLNSSYGNKEQLIALNKALRDAGIKPIADIVINHRCADKQDENGVWIVYGDDVEHPGDSIAFGPEMIVSDDPNTPGHGNRDSGDDYEAAPDLDHANPHLRHLVKQWMTWLREEIGFVSFRFDYVCGYAAKYIKEYIEATSTSEELNIVEYWAPSNWDGENLVYDQNSSRQVLCNYLDDAGNSCTAFDFTLKGILNETMKNTEYWRLIDPKGKATGLNGWWPKRAVTFVGNHDTDSTQGHWRFPDEHIEAGYAYILTHPGMPCIFYDDLLKRNDGVEKAIKTLVEIRKRNRILSDSKLEILIAEADLYVARIGKRITVKLGPRHDIGELVPKEEEGWVFAAAGKDWAVWEIKTEALESVCDPEEKVPYDPAVVMGHAHRRLRYKKTRR